MAEHAPCVICGRLGIWTRTEVEFSAPRSTIYTAVPGTSRSYCWDHIGAPYSGRGTT